MRKYYFGQNGKLVRNKVLQHCLDDPLVAETCHRFLEPDEHVKLLKEKLREEAEEVIEAVSHEEMIEELADVYEVTLEIMKQQGITQKELLEYQDRKKHEKGTFSDGVFIEHVLLDESSPWNKKFEKLPAKYREEIGGIANPLFITGNQHKAKHMQALLGIDIDHETLDVDEIQSLQPEAVIEHKVRQAYTIAGRPVFVDDFSLWFDDYDGLPGPFIKFFVQAEDGLEKLCRLADTLPTRRATGRAYFGYFDGRDVTIIYGEVKGEIVDHPRGEADYAFGSDPIFAVDGYGGKTRAELSADEYDELYRKVRAIDDIREFLKSQQKG